MATAQRHGRSEPLSTSTSVRGTQHCQLAPRSKFTELTVLAISDIRSQPLEDLVAHVRRLPDRPDLIVYAGDDVGRFRDGSRNYFEELASLARFGLVAVIGNDDGPEARKYVRGNRVYEVHSSPVLIGDILVVGLEGAPKRRGITGIGSPLYTERGIREHLQATSANYRGPIFVVSHPPPFKVLDRAMRFGDANIGSKALRAFIASDDRVQLAVCGHCHLHGGKTEQLHCATVINAASHDGKDDLIRIAHFTWRRGYTLVHGRPAVHFDHARPWGELECISGIWHTDFTKLWKAGITTVDQLAATPPITLGIILRRRPEAVKQFTRLAEARARLRPVAIAPLVAPAHPRVYFDIETDPYGGDKLCWLIGVLDEKSGQFTQLLAKTPVQEREILVQFADLCRSFGARNLLSYSGSNFDRRNLVVRMKELAVDVPEGLTNALDLLYPIQRSVAFPCTGYRLKDIARCLGFNHRHADLDGLLVAAEYMRLAKRRKPIPRRFLEYNEDDVRALQHIITRVEQLAGLSPPPISHARKT